MEGLCVNPAVYAAIVPGVILAMGIGFAIGRAWERVFRSGQGEQS